MTTLGSAVWAVCFGLLAAMRFMAHYAYEVAVAFTDVERGWRGRRRL